jgi:hypothetical protein
VSGPQQGRTLTPAPSYFEHNDAGAPQLDVIDIPGMLVTESRAETAQYTLTAWLHVSEVCERDSAASRPCSKCGALDSEGCQL